LVAAFDLRRQFVLNGTHAEYDRVNALKLPDLSSIGSKRRFRRPMATLHGVVFDIFGRRRGDPGVPAEHPA
jgi:hypothetical protein